MVAVEAILKVFGIDLNNDTTEVDNTFLVTLIAFLITGLPVTAIEKATKCNAMSAVSYTHLTLPTIYSV